MRLTPWHMTWWSLDHSPTVSGQPINLLFTCSTSSSATLPGTTPLIKTMKLRNLTPSQSAPPQTECMELTDSIPPAICFRLLRIYSNRKLWPFRSLCRRLRAKHFRWLRPKEHRTSIASVAQKLEGSNLIFLMPPVAYLAKLAVQTSRWHMILQVQQSMCSKTLPRPSSLWRRSALISQTRPVSNPLLSCKRMRLQVR